MSVFRAWEEWAIYSGDFLTSLQNIFLGLISAEKEGPEIKRKKILDTSYDDDVDGVPLSDDDVDGVPISSSSLSDVPQLPPSPVANFKLSKWETVESTPNKD